MPFPISLQQDEYEALVELARQGTLAADGTVLPDKARTLESYLVMLEKNNGIARYAVWIQWQETGAQLPPNTLFPEKWPPELRAYLSMTSRPIAKTDVQTLLSNKAINPMTVLVTKDPGATVGWMSIDTFFK